MKKKLTILGLGLFLFYLPTSGCNLLGTGAFAQEGTIYDNANGGIPNQSEISDKIEKIDQPNISDKIEITEQPVDYKEISDKINESFQENLANSLEIGGKPAYEKIINGQVCYFVEGLDCPLGKIEFGDNIPHNLAAGIRYGISQGFKDLESIFDYTLKEINTLKNTIETEGEKTFIYVKLKDIEDTKSSVQNKEE